MSTQDKTAAVLRAAYDAGFAEAGEGYNGEYGGPAREGAFEEWRRGRPADEVVIAIPAGQLKSLLSVLSSVRDAVEGAVNLSPEERAPYAEIAGRHDSAGPHFRRMRLRRELRRRWLNPDDYARHVKPEGSG